MAKANAKAKAKATAKQDGRRPNANVILEPALTFLRELWALDHALSSTSKRMFDRLGITAQQRMVLRFVGKFPGITAVDLAAMLHVEKSTLSLALGRLEARNLISRRRDAVDARKTEIALTDEGRKFNVPVVGTVEKAVARALEGSSPRQIEEVRSFLQRLSHLLSSDEDVLEAHRSIKKLRARRTGARSR